MNHSTLLFCVAAFCLGYYIAAAIGRDELNREKYGPTGEGWPKEYIVKLIEERILFEPSGNDARSAQRDVSTIRIEAEHIVDGATRGVKTYYA
jgi:hypothetical protein